MNIQDRSDKRLTVVDGNNLVLKDNNFIISGCVMSVSESSSLNLEVSLLVTMTSGVMFFNTEEIQFSGVSDESVTHTVPAEGIYYVWIGLNSSGEVVSYLTESYESPVYDPDTELLMKCVKVSVVYSGV